jgi:hypothetical protein
VGFCLYVAYMWWPLIVGGLVVYFVFKLFSASGPDFIVHVWKR